MRYFRDVPSIHTILEKVKCDMCNKTYTVNDKYDDFEIQEFLTIRERGGYASLFGDGTEYELDLCQECTEELLGQYIRIINIQEE